MTAPFGVASNSKEMSHPNKPRGESDLTAVQLIEEAIHLLRQAPASSWIPYALGSSAWILGFLFFWAYTTWFAPSRFTIAWAAVGMAGLYVALKTTQADFCARLLAQRLGSTPPPFTWRRGLRLAAVQTQFQSWGVILLPIALVLNVPFGWAFSFFQTVTVLGLPVEERSSLTQEAVSEARRWPGQNHLGLVYLSVIAGAAWINLAVAFVGVPWLANRLLGVQNIFGFGGMWWFNTTFLASVTALTWLAVDPLVKAFYVLRVFYGRSQHTGDDLRIGLLASKPLRRSREVVAALLLLALFVPGNSLHAENPAPATVVQTIDPVLLDQSIDQVLTQRDFQWQLRPKPTAKKDGEAGWVRRFFQEGIEIIKAMVASCVDFFRSVKNWIQDLLPGEDDPEEASSTTGLSLSSLRLLLYGLIAIGVGLIVVVMRMMWRNARRVPVGESIARAVTRAQPDLRDENIEAAHLPTEGWLALAGEQMAKGEWRLALRALYLATLAGLAAEGLVTLVKSKTNLDYARELRRRAPANAALVDGFAERLRAFEEVWYGQTAAGEDRVRQWFAEMQRRTKP